MAFGLATTAKVSDSVVLSLPIHLKTIQKSFSQRLFGVLPVTCPFLTDIQDDFRSVASCSILDISLAASQC